jgi:PGF-CTERM protein
MLLTLPIACVECRTYRAVLIAGENETEICKQASFHDIYNMRGALIKQGFTAANIKLVPSLTTDGSYIQNVDALWPQVEVQLNWLINKAGPKDKSLICYMGHVAFISGSDEPVVILNANKYLLNQIGARGNSVIFVRKANQNRRYEVNTKSTHNKAGLERQGWSNLPNNYHSSGNYHYNETAKIGPGPNNVFKIIVYDGLNDGRYCYNTIKGDNDKNLDNGWELRLRDEPQGDQDDEVLLFYNNTHKSPDNSDGYITDDLFAAKISRIKGEKMIVIDACDASSMADGTDDLRAGNTLSVMMSSGEGQKAKFKNETPERYRQGHKPYGVFSRHLIKKLEDHTGKRGLTEGEWFDYAKDETEEESGNRQNPKYESGNGCGRYIVPVSAVIKHTRTFTAIFDTTGVPTGTYIVKADDGDGHVDEVEVFITGAEAKAIKEGVKEVAEVVGEEIEEITATPMPTPAPTPEPTPEPTPKPPGFEAIFAIAGLLSVVYLLRRKG